MIGFGVFLFPSVSFLGFPQPASGALPLLVVAVALLTGCLVNNPAYDPAIDETPIDAMETLDVGGAKDGAVIDAPIVDAAFMPDAGVVNHDAVADSQGDVVGDTKFVPPVPTLCDAKGPELSLCVTFDGNVTDHSANAITLLGVPKFVPGIDGSAYEVNNGVGLRSDPSPAFVSKEVTVDLWVRMSAFPETQVQALVVVPGVISLSVTAQGQVFCDLGVIRAISPNNMLKRNTWTGVSCNYDGAGINIYANGQSAAGRPDSTIVPSATTSSINIGSASGFSPFTGDIDNLRFWRKRVSPIELCKSSPECVQ
jgi:hypothetical protein